MSHSLLLTVRNISDKICRENKKKLFSNLFENRAFYELMWKKCVERVRPQMAIRRVHITCGITKATITHLQYVITIAFPQKLRLHERASMLLNTYSLSC